jgi:thioredoxin 1
MSQIFEADDATFEAEVEKAEGAVLVDFSAVWCAPCKRLEPVVHEIAAEYEGRLKVVKVDVDHARTAAAKYAVMSVPTLILFRDGTVKEQVTGLVPKQAITDKVDQVL